MTAAAVDITPLLARRLALNVPVVWLTQILLPALLALYVEMGPTRLAAKCPVIHVLQGLQTLTRLRPHLVQLV